MINKSPKALRTFVMGQIYCDPSEPIGTNFRSSQSLDAWSLLRKWCNVFIEKNILLYAQIHFLSNSPKSSAACTPFIHVK